MQVKPNAREWRVEVWLDNEPEEACYVYDLVQSGRLQVDNKDVLPLPLRGDFLFFLPGQSRPLALRVGRFDAPAESKLAGGPEVLLYFAPPRGPEAVLTELETALRELPPASSEDFVKPGALDAHAKVRALTHAQKIIFATRADQTGRAILMQQPNPLLLLYLVKNPLITLPELIAIAKLPSIDALVAEYLAKLVRGNPQLGQNEELRMALATNAKTPGGTALSLLKTLNSRNLRHICKHGETRGVIKQAAVRILTERRD